MNTETIQVEETIAAGASEPLLRETTLATNDHETKKSVRSLELDGQEIQVSPDSDSSDNTASVSPSDESESVAEDDEITEALLTKDREAANCDPKIPFHKTGTDYHQPHLEAALLSTCMNKTSMIDKVIRELNPGDFFVEIHQAIFDAMLHVFNSGKEISYCELLKHLVSLEPDLESHWINWLNAVQATSYSFKHVNLYISLLKSAAEIRGGKDFCPQKYSEDFSAQLLLARLPDIRCVGNLWYRYVGGIWEEVQLHVFRREALEVIHPSHRQARRGTDILTHVESLAQFSGRLYGGYRFGENGAILINAANCVVQVGADGAVSELAHTSEFDFTRKLAVSYDPGAVCVLFESKLEEMLPDPEDREVLQLFCGYILYPSRKLETALVAYGPTGTGKSTMASVVAEVLGPDLVGACGLEEICKASSYSLPGLRLKMLNLGSELTGTEAVESANFKKLISGETMNVRPIYGAPVDMKATVKFLFLSNHQPRFYCGTEAEARRLRILHFDKEPETKDTDLKEKLTQELSGVFNWMVEGLVKLLKAKQIPEGGSAARTMLRSFSKGNDPVGSFVNERCILGPGEKMVKRDLYSEFAD